MKSVATEREPSASSGLPAAASLDGGDGEEDEGGWCGGCVGGKLACRTAYAAVHGGGSAPCCGVGARTGGIVQVVGVRFGSTEPWRRRTKSRSSCAATHS